MRFTKMHGLGNDYVYIDCFRDPVPEDIAKLAVTVSDRHFGIGGDGLVLIMRSAVADCRMRMFNADGSEGRMCGNAIRCVAKYVFDEGYVHNNEMRIETLSGIRNLRVETIDSVVSSVTVDMGEVRCGFIDREITVGDRTFCGTSVDVGNPHFVIMVDGVNDFDLAKYGPLFEHNDLFPDRVNTEIVEKIGANRIRMRVWERGSGETMACGTGACAAVTACCCNGVVDRDTCVTVELSGGFLEIVCTSDDKVFMKGLATRVFDGELYFK